MKPVSRISPYYVTSAFALLIAACLVGAPHAADGAKQPVNPFGAAVRNTNGDPINYSAADLAKMKARAVEAGTATSPEAPVKNEASVPATSGEVAPFWQYSIFGSAIGASQIIVVPDAPGNPRQIIVGGNSRNDFGGDNFWQVLRRNTTTGNYDQLFVSPLYSSTIAAIALGNVVGDSESEIVVMLADGSIYFYDSATRADLGSVSTGWANVQALSLTDLNGDGVAELLVTTSDDLAVFDGDGHLLWQVAGAGGFDVVAGQMDTDPALEIATTNGTVIDCATHAIQWTRSGGFGAHLKLAPLAGAPYQQLVAASSWYDIYSYDVATQLPIWSITMQLDIGAIAVADVDNDGTPEVLAGDGQWGGIHVFNLITQVEKWQTNNPEHGVTNIAVDDVDGDGVVDLLWGAGWSSTGSDYLYIANTTGQHNIKWQSVDLQGPFLGPLIGDLDGDGKAELVVCSFASESDYDSGRILVFDLATQALRGISAPVSNNLGWTGVHDLKLRDLDGDGRMEIVVATDRLYDGVIEIYGFDSSNAFTLKWTNSTRPEGSPFNFVEVADLDGNGTPEIIAGNDVEHTGSDGVFVYIFDYPSTAAPWRSVKLAGGFASLTGLVVADLDGNGSKEIAALVSTGDLYTFDGPTRQLKNLKQQTDATIITDRRTTPGLILGDHVGGGHFWKYEANTYTESFTRSLGSSALDGLTVAADGGLWIGTGGALKLRLPPAYRGVAWQSPVFGASFGHTVAFDSSTGQNRVFSSAAHAVAGFAFEAVIPPAPSVLGNISTRLRVEAGDGVLIGGFIVAGTEPKKVIVRAIGPSLSEFGVANPLANPTLELHGPNGLIASNGDWINSVDKQAIIDSGLAPKSDLESALIATLPANNTGYTAMVHDLNNVPGIGVVEVFDLDTKVDSNMANISARGLVQTGEDLLFAGTVVVGPSPRRVIVRAIGPSLPLADKLSDPTLELRNGNGVIVEANDNWVTSPNNEAISAAGLAPNHPLEAAILSTLAGNNALYTAVVRGANNSNGIAVVEVFALED